MEMLHSKIPNSLSFWNLFLQSDFVVQSTMVVLVFMSVAIWSVIFEKLYQFRHFNQSMKKFEKNFYRNENLADLIYKVNKTRKKQEAEYNLMPNVLFAIVAEFELEKSHEERGVNVSEGRYFIYDIIENIIQIEYGKTLKKMEYRLSLLATAAVASPFIGLFGTVWGIMNSFQSIAAMKNTSLAVVAPGIAEALFATALGLITAIPAVIFYNRFQMQIKEFLSRADSLCLELNNIFMRMR